MKKHVVGALALTMMLVGVSDLASAVGVRSWDDYSWWGNSGATPLPVKDDYHPGYWWWPTVPASNVNDEELWGNRGVVYHIWSPAAPAVEEPAPPPVAPPPPVQRQIPVFNNVLFDFDKSVLKPEGQAEVDKVVSLMKEYPQDSVTVVGHTDDIGTEQYNMGLGQRRADAVMRYMLESGIAPGRVSAVSRGETDPAVPNTSAANRRLNRRVVFDYAIGGS